MKTTRRSFLHASTHAGASLLFARAAETGAPLPADIWDTFKNRRSAAPRSAIGSSPSAHSQPSNQP